MRIITLSTAAAALALLAAPAMADVANMSSTIDDKCEINAGSVDVTDAADVAANDSTVEFSITCNNDFKITFNDGATGAGTADQVVMTNASAQVDGADYSNTFTGDATLSGMKSGSAIDATAGTYKGQNSDLTYTIDWGLADTDGHAGGTYTGAATIIVDSNAS